MAAGAGPSFWENELNELFQVSFFSPLLTNTRSCINLTVSATHTFELQMKNLARRGDFPVSLFSERARGESGTSFLAA
jgi:hypothetical protein